MMLLWPYSPALAVGVLALSHALILYPTFRPNVQWLGPVVTHFATDRREVWLTIDDGPTDDTPQVLELFARHDVRATFFVKGTLARQHPDLVKAIVNHGHSLANHSMTHPAGSFWCALPGRVGAEIDGCNSALRDVAGTAPTWFRAPVGNKNPFVHPQLARRGMRLIGWTSRGFDAVVSDAGQVLSRIQRSIRPGAIILLHQGRDHSLDILERLIVSLQEQGYRFVIPDDTLLRCGSFGENGSQLSADSSAA